VSGVAYSTVQFDVHPVSGWGYSGDVGHCVLCGVATGGTKPPKRIRRNERMKYRFFTWRDMERITDRLLGVNPLYLQEWDLCLYYRNVEIHPTGLMVPSMFFKGRRVINRVHDG